MSFEFNYGKYSSKDKMPNSQKVLGRGSSRHLDPGTHDQMTTVGGPEWRKDRFVRHPERQFVHSDIPPNRPRYDEMAAQRQSALGVSPGGASPNYGFTPQPQQQHPFMDFLDQIVKQLLGGPAGQQQQGNPGMPTNQVGGGTYRRDGGY
jgi:hypothetical protein